MSGDGKVPEYLDANTYKSMLLSLDAQRMVFVLYHIMKLRPGDIMPSLQRMNAVGEEHGILTMTLEDLICYERWLNL